MSWTCEACSKVIFGTSSDPLVSTKGLGWKNYHYACAQAAWGISVMKPNPARNDSPSIPTACPARGGKSGRGKFLVQCTFTKDGSPTVCLSDFTNSLQEAEDYFKRQVSKIPPNGGVNCAVLLVLKNGKRTQVDGHSFGVPANAGILGNHRASACRAESVATGPDETGEEDDE